MVSVVKYHRCTVRLRHIMHGIEVNIIMVIIIIHHQHQHQHHSLLLLDAKPLLLHVVRVG